MNEVRSTNPIPHTSAELEGQQMTKDRATRKVQVRSGRKTAASSRDETSVTYGIVRCALTQCNGGELEE